MSLWVGAWEVVPVLKVHRGHEEIGYLGLSILLIWQSEYVAQLFALDKSLTAFWADMTDVDDRTLCLAKPQLSVDFCFI